MKTKKTSNIGNGQNTAPTKDYWIICIQNDSSTARDTWGIKLVPQLNHDLLSFMSAMKEGWQMNGRWKKHEIEIEFFTKDMKVSFSDGMIPSGSSWQLGVKVK